MNHRHPHPPTPSHMGEWRAIKIEDICFKFKSPEPEWTLTVAPLDQTNATDMRGGLMSIFMHANRARCYQ